MDRKRTSAGQRPRETEEASRHTNTTRTRARDPRECHQPHGSFAALETYNKAKQGRYKTKRAAEKDLSSRSGGQRQTSRGVKPGLKVFKMQPDGTWAQTL